MVAGVAIQIGSTTSSVASAVVYRPGNAAMSSWTSSNGLTNVLAYDTDGRLTAISVPGVQSLALTYDPANRISSITNGIDGTLTQTFGYDAMSRLSAVSSIADNESYQYDANGNRIAQVNNGVSTLSTVSATSNRLSGFGSTSYGYDTRGNTTTVAGAATYHYDAFNRMDSAAGTSYYVNPEGQRLRKSGTAGTSYFAPDSSGSLLAESQGSGWTDYVWLNGRLVGRVAGGQINAVHDDQVGRPEVVTNAAQAIVWRAQNFAFNQNVVVSNITFNLGFPGQYYDAETAAWNNGYRDYKSELGRYVESDPMGLGGGVNTYTYVSGDPLNYVDSLGLATFLFGGNASGTVGIGGQGSVGIYFNPGLNGQSFGLGVFSTQGGAAGFNVGAGIFGGVMTGPTCKLEGNTVDTNWAGGIFQAAYSISPDDGTSTYIGGLSLKGIPAGASVSYSHTEAFGVEDIGPLLQHLYYNAMNNATQIGVAQRGY